MARGPLEERATAVDDQTSVDRGYRPARWFAPSLAVAVLASAAAAMDVWNPHTTAVAVVAVVCAVAALVQGDGAARDARLSSFIEGGDRPSDDRRQG